MRGQTKIKYVGLTLILRSMMNDHGFIYTKSYHMWHARTITIASFNLCLNSKIELIDVFYLKCELETYVKVKRP